MKRRRLENSSRSAFSVVQMMCPFLLMLAVGKTNAAVGFERERINTVVYRHRVKTRALDFRSRRDRLLLTAVQNHTYSTVLEIHILPFAKHFFPSLGSLLGREATIGVAGKTTNTGQSRRSSKLITYLKFENECFHPSCVSMPSVHVRRRIRRSAVSDI